MIAAAREVGVVGVDRLLEIVGDLYEAATDPARIAGVGGRIAREIGAESALVFVARKNDARLVHMVSSTGNFDEAARAAYDAHFHERNEWFSRGSQLPSPAAVLGGELIDYADFERTEFWNDWCRPVGIYHTLGSTAPIGGGMIAAMGIHRPRTATAFGEEERAFVRRLVPHLARSLLLAEKLGAARRQQEMTTDTLHGLGIGLVLVDGGYRIVFANALAERLVRKSRWMTSSNGRIRAIHPASARQFEAAIGRAVETSGGAGLSAGGVLRLRDPLARELAVLVTPFRAGAWQSGSTGPVAAVLFSDPDERRLPAGAAVAAVFGLTVAEGALVAGLVGGHTLASYASSAGLSFHTARAQLRSVFEKTGFSRQAELVAAVLSEPVARLGG